MYSKLVVSHSYMRNSASTRCLSRKCSCNFIKCAEFTPTRYSYSFIIFICTFIIHDISKMPKEKILAECYKACQMNCKITVLHSYKRKLCALGPSEHIARKKRSCRYRGCSKRTRKRPCGLQGRQRCRCHCHQAVQQYLCPIGVQLY